MHCINSLIYYVKLKKSKSKFSMFSVKSGSDTDNKCSAPVYIIIQPENCGDVVVTSGRWNGWTKEVGMVARN